MGRLQWRRIHAVYLLVIQLKVNLNGSGDIFDLNKIV